MGKRTFKLYPRTLALISITDLSFAYQNQLILEKINLEYELPHFLGIIGENGGGKTTLIKIILGLINSHTPISKKLPLDQIGYVPQYLSSNSNFPICVFELVLMGRTKSFGLYSKQDKTKAYQALETLKISHLASRRFDSLSGGQKQKVLIARALCSNCKLLILDEPTASIDAYAKNEIFELLAQLNHNGVGIIAICHDLELLLTYSTQIAHIKKTLHLFTMPQDKVKLLESLKYPYSTGLDNGNI